MTDDTAKRLREIEERHAASTPGEWWVEGSYPAIYAHVDGGGRPNGEGLFMTDGYHSRRNPAALKDAQFIAHAHQDVPFLLAEIKRLQERLDNQREHQWGDLEKLALSFKENF